MTQILISVQAGLIPGQVEEDRTRIFTVESSYTADQYREIVKNADEYAMSLRDPAILNWVRTEWIYL